MPIGGVDRPRGAEHEQQDCNQLDEDHRVVGLGAFLHAAHEDPTEQHQQQESGEVEPRAGCLAAREHGVREFHGQVEAEQVIEKVIHVCAEADSDRHVRDRVFEDQVPADDPGEDLAHGRVGVGVSAAGHGDHRREFGVAERGEAAGDGDQHEGERNRRAGAGTSHHGDWSAVEYHVEHGRLEDRRQIHPGPRGSGAREGENARADDGADAQRNQAPQTKAAAQAAGRRLACLDQIVDALGAVERHRASKEPSACVDP